MAFGKLVAFHAFVFLVKHGENTFGACNGGLYLPVDLSYVVYGAAKLLCIHYKCGYNADRDVPAYGKLAAESCDDYKLDVAYKVHHRPHYAAVYIRAYAGRPHFVRRFAEIINRLILTIVGNDGLVSARHLLDGSVYHAEKSLLTL